MNTWDLQDWLTCGVVLGVLLMVAIWWMLMKRVFKPGSRLHRGLQFFALVLVLLPAGLKWYFSKSLIMLIAVLLCCFGAFQWLRNSSGG